MEDAEYIPKDGDTETDASTTDTGNKGQYGEQREDDIRQEQNVWQKVIGWILKALKITKPQS